METIAGFLGHNSAEIREVAAKTLGTLLSADYFQQADSHDKAVKALVTALDAAGTDLAVRVAALDALGSAGESARRSDSAMAWLKVDRTATTFKEHAARIRAIGETGRADQTAAIATFLEQLPLDSPPEIQEAAGRALGRLDGKEATRHLLKRLTSKSDAGLEIVSEIALLGDLKAEIAAPALLEAANRIEAHSERLAFATACAKVADPSLVPALGPMLDPLYSDVRYYATEALRKIDTDEAASMVWPSLSQETDLVRKLQLAEFLGRHGFRGGYPYAIEHMSAPMLQHVAIDALASIREPKAIPELRKILETSNDVGWNSAAIRALGRLGQNDLAPRMLELAGDRKNPLATPAMIALCDLGEAKALPIVLDALASRNDNVVDDAIQASQKLLAAPNVQGDAVRDRLAALLADSDTSQVVRSTAFNALLALKDPRLGPALATAVRDAGLEHSDLLLRIEQTLSTRKEKLNLK
jgi:HEAT repeat protein